MELTKEGQETLNKLATLGKASPELAFRLEKEIGKDAEKEVIIRTPILSASMVSTVRSEINRRLHTITIKVGGIMAKFSRAGFKRNFVDYAIYPEEGTRTQAGVHMLVRGVNAALVKKNSIARRAFESWIAKFK